MLWPHQFASRLPLLLSLLASGLFGVVPVYNGYAELVELPPSADTTLFELDPDYNLGGQRDLPAGTLGSVVGSTRSRMLIKFDVAAGLPVGAEITAARFKTNVVRTPVGKKNSSFALHRVLVDWVEGDKRGDNPGGAPASVGETTWNARMHPDTGWATPGGAFDTDFAAAVSAERSVVGNGAYTFEFNATGIADLEEMLADPATNYGWMLTTQEEGDSKTARRWSAKEHRTDPPVLEIEFTQAPTPSPLKVALDGVPESPTIRFQGAPNVTYRIEKSHDLTLWEALVITGPFGSEQGVEVVDPDPGNAAFYRILATF